MKYTIFLTTEDINEILQFYKCTHNSNVLFSLPDVEHVRLARAAASCSGEACRASCILNGHNGGSCNSNDHCDCN